MIEYTNGSVKVVFNDNEKTSYPIGVRLYSDGALHFMDVENAVWLKKMLKKIIKEYCSVEKNKEVV